MASFVRTSLALMLLLAAVASALGGLGAQWIDHAARTPDPLYAIVGPLSSDPRVIDAIAVELSAAAAEQLPAIIDRLPGVRPLLEDLVGRAVNAALTDEGVTQAWHEAIDLSREDFVAGLDAMRTGGGDAPTLWLPLQPFLDMGQARLVEMTPEALRPYVSGMEIPTENLRIALGRPDSIQARYAADALGVAAHWIWFYVVAVVFAVLGLVSGSRRGRWVAWTLAAGAGTVAVMLGRTVLAGIDLPEGDSLTSLIKAGLIEGTTSSLLAWTAPAVTAGLVLLVFGILALAISSAGTRKLP